MTVHVPEFARSRELGSTTLGEDASSPGRRRIAGVEHNVRLLCRLAAGELDRGTRDHAACIGAELEVVQAHKY